MSAIGILLGAAFSFYLWTASSSDNPFAFGPRPSNYYQDFYNSNDFLYTLNYYNLLSDAFLSGRLSLLVEPRKELLDLPDPYHPVFNTGLRLHDAALYNGKYYLTSGPTPALVLFTPFHLIFTRDMPENLAAALFCFGGLCWSVLLLTLLTRTYLPKTPLWMQLTAVLCLSLSNVAPFILRTRGFYSVQISSGYCFLFGGFYWALAGALKEGRARLWRLVLGSLFLGLAVGSRPHHILAATFLLLLWLKFSRERQDHRIGEALRESCCLFLPYLMCIGLLALYNFARFGSPAEFGYGYALTAGVSQREWNRFDPKRILPDLFFYFLAPSDMSLGFPFFRLAAPQYPWALPEDYYGPEPVAGILTNMPFLGILSLAPLLYGGVHGIRYVRLTVGFFVFLGLTLACIIGALSATMRYAVDFVSLFLLAAILVWFHLDTQWRGAKVKRSFLRCVSVGFMLYGCLFNLAISLTGYGPQDSLRYHNPKAYQRIEKFFIPLQRLVVKYLIS